MTFMKIVLWGLLAAAIGLFLAAFALLPSSHGVEYVRAYRGHVPDLVCGEAGAGEALILLGLLVIVGYALSGACEMVWYALGAA